MDVEAKELESSVIRRKRSFTPGSHTPRRYGKNFSFNGTSSDVNADTSTAGAADLDWDKWEDFRRMTESDRMSVYDLNEQMAELIRLKLLEFEALSMTGSMKSFQAMACNRRSSLEPGNLDAEFEAASEPDFGSQRRPLAMRRVRNLTNSSVVSARSELTPVECLTLDDLFKCKLLSLEQSLRASSAVNLNNSKSANTYPPITFDLESLYASMSYPVEATNETANVNFYHSMPDLRVFSEQTGLVRGSSSKSIKLVCKHASLMDMRSFEWIYIKRKAAAVQNQVASLKATPNSANELGVERRNDDDASSESSHANALPSAVNFSRMSRLTMLRTYMTKLGEKVKQILNEVFSPPTDLAVGQQSAADAQRAYAFNVRTSNLYSINEETVESYDIIENPVDITTTACVNKTDADRQQRSNTETTE